MTVRLNTVLTNQSLVGRPVLRLGTERMAAKKLASPMEANALIPARINSVFLMGVVSFAARSFKSSKTANSGLGNVKLSRTILTFFIFTGFSAGVVLATRTFLAATLLLAGVLTDGTDLVAALAETFTAGFFATGAAALATAFTGAGAPVDLVSGAAAGVLVTGIVIFLDKRYIQFISFIRLQQ